MAEQIRSISLADFRRQLDACLSDSEAGRLIRITDAGHDAILMGQEQWQFIVESLLTLEQLLYRQ